MNFFQHERLSGRWWFLLLPLFGACQPNQQSLSATTALTVWAHAGQPAERSVLQRQVARFNAAHPDTPVTISFLPERDYNAQIQAAALADDLPAILEFDGPYLANYVWKGYLQPLSNLLPEPIKNDLLPSLLRQGQIQGNLYAVGMFDSGLGLYARKSQLLQVQARLPNGPADAWTIAEFNQLLARLARQQNHTAILDLKLNYSGEWFSYGFSPMLQSAGGDLIDRRNYQSAAGVLNGPASRFALQQLQQWFQQGYVDANLDDRAFVDGRTALSWVGHWEYERYAKQFNDDLLVLPLPNFGTGSKTGQGSWVWGITSACKDPEKAMRFIEFLLETKQVLEMADTNGAVPGTKSAVAKSGLYREQGPLHLFAKQLIQGFSVARPQTPAYPTISVVFYEVFMDIRNGADIKSSLARAITEIDQVIQDNHGFRNPDKP